MFVILLIFTLMLAIITMMFKGVKEGKINADVLADAVMVMIIAVAAGLLFAIIRLFRRHKRHMKQASSADILAEIMAMKDDKSQNSKED
jgi:Ca2+/H+ antiporter